MTRSKETVGPHRPSQRSQNRGRNQTSNDANDEAGNLRARRRTTREQREQREVEREARQLLEDEEVQIGQMHSGNAPREPAPQPPANTYNIAFGNLEQSQRYNTLVGRGLVLPRFYHALSLITLGIREQVEGLFKNVGWGELLSKAEGVYPALVLEFLSSLSATTGGRNPQINFRLRGKDYTIPIPIVSAAFGFPLDAPHLIVDRGFNQISFWNTISCRRDGDITYHTIYDSSRSKSGDIYNLSLRIAHRIMASTVFGREDSVGNCGVKELYCLYCMLHNIKVNPVDWMLTQWIKVSRGKQTGGVVVGGMVMILLRYLELVTEESPPDLPSDPLTLDRFKHADWIALRSRTWYARHWKTDLYAFPNPLLSDPMNFANHLPIPPPLESQPSPGHRAPVTRPTPNTGHHAESSATAEAREPGTQQDPHVTMDTDPPQPFQTDTCPSFADDTRRQRRRGRQTTEFDQDQISLQMEAGFGRLEEQQRTTHTYFDDRLDREHQYNHRRYNQLAAQQLASHDYFDGRYNQMQQNHNQMYSTLTQFQSQNQQQIQDLGQSMNQSISNLTDMFQQWMHQQHPPPSQ